MLYNTPWARDSDSNVILAQIILCQLSALFIERSRKHEITMISIFVLVWRI
jgi:hypothetical protein